ncbi:hypothetical protein [Psychromonas ossibalaenae]|uniref:hypothetical protein n=1 Tax=Psychromonas ossibalaenae TaxID=444922 RepID=UPI0003716A3A|nr:hypothetical protein [Psychromonas ossibalaenae]
MSSQKVLTIFIICFLLPLGGAFLLLKSDWLPGSTVNNGQFLVPEVKLEQWSKINPKPWAIALRVAGQCESGCSVYISELKNIYLALGKNQNKVDLVLLGSAGRQVKGFKNYTYPSGALKADYLYLVDHMGLVVFSYELDRDLQTNRITAKGLIKDLKKLLKYARSS